MKLIYILILWPLIGYAQPIWTTSISENSFEYRRGNSELKKYNKPALVCFNDYAFGFKVENKLVVFEMDDYRDEIMGGYHANVFYNKSSDMEDYKSFMIFIIHTKPAKIYIQHTSEPSFMYVITTDKIPLVIVKKSSQLTKAQEKEIDANNSVRERIKRESDSIQIIAQSIRQERELERNQSANESERRRREYAESKKMKQVSNRNVNYEFSTAKGSHIADSMRRADNERKYKQGRSRRQ